MSLEKIKAFLKKDFTELTSYKLSFILEIAGIFTSIFTFFFISKLVGGAAAQHLELYGTDYFGFVLVGMAFAAYFWQGFSTFAGAIAYGQVGGTLEIMLSTPTRLPILLLGSSAFGFLRTTFVVVIYLITGSLLGVNLGSANLTAALVVFVLTIITFSSLGLISAAFIMAFKRGDPIAWFFGSVGTLLGGAMFPITLLPVWLQRVSEVIPITHALRSMRLALLQGYTITQLSSDILILVLFSVILLPLSILIFDFFIKRAKKEGSLLKY